MRLAPLTLIRYSQILTPKISTSILINSILVLAFIYLIILHVVVFLTVDEFDDDEPENRELVNLGPMAKYCRNEKDCRRQQLLTYLGWGDIEANVCLPDSEAICDNCERRNVSKPLYFNFTVSTKPVCRVNIESV